MPEMQISEVVRKLTADTRNNNLTSTDYQNIIAVFEKGFADLSPDEKEAAANGYWFYSRKAYSETPPTLNDVAEKIKVFGSDRQLAFAYRNSIAELFKKSIQDTEHVNKVGIVFSDKLSEQNDITGLATKSTDLAAFLLEQNQLIENPDFRMALNRAATDILGIRSIAFGLVESLKNGRFDVQNNKKIMEIVILVLNSSNDEPKFDTGARIGTGKTITGMTIPKFSQQGENYNYTNVIRPEDKAYLISVKK